MRRGDLYRVSKPTARDSKRSRVFAVVSRQALIDTRFATVVCAPVYTARHGLSTQVPVGIDEGLKHESSLHCDELMSLPKMVLTHYVGRLSQLTLRHLDRALAAALDIDAANLAPPSRSVR